MEHVDADDSFIPVSDLMSGLAMIFLLLALLFIEDAQETSVAPSNSSGLPSPSARVEEVSAHGEAAADAIRAALFEHLRFVLAADLPRWHAQLDADLTLRFEAPDLLFETGQAELRPSFVAILADLVPRYLSVLRDERFARSVDMVRIDGHASARWGERTRPDEAWLRNMALSQDRAVQTLRRVLAAAPESDHDWLRARLVAIGLSSSRPVQDHGGGEDAAASQRVEIRIGLFGTVTEQVLPGERPP